MHNNLYKAIKDPVMSISSQEFTISPFFAMSTEDYIFMIFNPKILSQYTSMKLG